MKFLKLLKYIFIPPIICFVLIYFTSNDLLYPLIFSLIIGVFNWKRFRFFKPIAFLLLLFISYLVIFLSIYMYIYIDKIIDNFLDNHLYVDIIYNVVVFCITPLLLITTYKLIFKITFNRINIIIITALIFILLLIASLPFYLESRFISDIYLYCFWNSLMVIGLQLILNKKELNF
jgi:hypothetical protein